MDMPTRQRRRLLQAQAGWMTAALVGLSLFDALSLGLYLVVSYLGFLTLVLATMAGGTSRPLRRRLLVLVLLGMVGFIALFVLRVREMLPPGVL